MIRLLLELRYEDGYYKSLFNKINEGEFLGHRKRRKSFDRQVYIDKAENYIIENLYIYHYCAKHPDPAGPLDKI